jgi:hypothetical protein
MTKDKSFANSGKSLYYFSSEPVPKLPEKIEKARET